jgi:hypothetical protein
VLRYLSQPRNLQHIRQTTIGLEAGKGWEGTEEGEEVEEVAAGEVEREESIRGLGKRGFEE